MPTDWNNVPKVVYEAVTAIVNSFDKFQTFSRLKLAENSSNYSSLKFKHEALARHHETLKEFTREEIKKTQIMIIERLLAAKLEAATKHNIHKNQIEGL
jgi:hypothetical protein